jgi:hypothetical protein
MPAIKFPYLTISCLLPAVFLAFFSHAQSLPDSLFYKRSITALQDRYKNELGQDSRLYIGAEYTGAGQRAKGTPFFLSDSVLQGSLFYHNTWYRDLGIQFDLLSDDLLISDYTQTYTIRLPKEMVDSFSIRDHFFYYADSSILVEAGYYEQLYRGRLLVMASHKKRVTFPASTEQQPYYRQYDDYFLVRDGRWTRVGDQGALIALLKDKKEEIKRFIRDEKTGPKKNFELLLIRTAAYYDQIK